MKPQPFRMTVITNPIDDAAVRALKDEWLMGLESLWLQHATDSVFKDGLQAITNRLMQTSGRAFPMVAVDSLYQNVMTRWFELRQRSDNKDLFLQEARLLLDKLWQTSTGPDDFIGPPYTQPQGTPVMDELDIEIKGIFGTVVLLIIAAAVAIGFTSTSR